MNLSQALSRAVFQLLKPLVRVLLRHGLAYDEFAELARRAYVDVAQTDFTLAGRKQTTSRVSVITGLNRKEVARLQAELAQADPAGAALAQTMNRAAKVAAGWLHEHADAQGAPQPINADQFAALVRKYSGDMPARAVLDELQHGGAVSTQDDGLLLLASQGYLPQATDTRKISLLGTHAAELLGSIDHNLSHPPEQAFLQQRVFAEQVPEADLPTVRALLRQSGQQALAQAREMLLARADAPDTPPTGAHRVSLGVYYFEEPAAGRNNTPTPTTPQRRRKAPAAPPSGDAQ
jgi:hypothetical protein